MLIRDHINFTAASPIEGATFVDLTDVYSPRLRALCKRVEPSLDEGVYVQFRGPQYETPAEIHMVGVMGADLVGMSTVLEAIAAREAGMEVLRPLLDHDMPPRTLINVNFPAIPAADVRGIRVTRQGFHDYGRGSIVEGTDPRGYPYYWFGLHGIEHSPGHDSDLEAIDDRFISVTPLQLDLTHDPSLAALRSAYA